MSEFSAPDFPDPSRDSATRCPVCDSVVTAGSETCLMCGANLDASEAAPSAGLPPEPGQVAAKDDRSAESRDSGAESTQEPAGQADPGPLSADHSALVSQEDEAEATGVFLSSMRERRSRILPALTAIMALLIIGGSLLVVLNPGEGFFLAEVREPSPIPPSDTATATLTPTAESETVAPPSPTATAIPMPTATPRPPRVHMVKSGETLTALSLIYGVSAESIANENQFTVDTSILAAQELLIPWPTATPPLESVIVEVNNQPVVADARNCNIVSIQEGDSISVLAANYGVPLDAIIAVNRLDEQSIHFVRPGDALCIPKILYTDALPPTPGPSPTATTAGPLPGPTLLYPADGATIESTPGPVRLQWLAVARLEEDQQYMVEVMITDRPEAFPLRGFTRDSSFAVPETWWPDANQDHRFEWRVSIVRVTGKRTDGGPIYTFGGRSSETREFVRRSALSGVAPATSDGT